MARLTKKPEVRRKPLSETQTGINLVKVKTHVDIAPLGHVLKQLSKITGKSFEKVVKTESAHILANALRATPKTNEKTCEKIISTRLSF